MSFLRDRSNRLRLSGYAVLTAAVAVVLTFGLLSIFHSASASSSVARTVTAEIGTVASSVSASGNVSPSQTDSVNFQTGGTLTAVDVAVGDKVKAGQVLAKIDPTDADDALKEAEDSVQVAESALADAESGGTAAQLEQNQAGLTSLAIRRSDVLPPVRASLLLTSLLLTSLLLAQEVQGTTLQAERTQIPLKAGRLRRPRRPRPIPNRR